MTAGAVTAGAVTAGAVTVWFIPARQPDSVLAELAGVLDDRERQRAGAITAPGRQAEYLVAHAATRLILGGLLDRPPAALRWRHGPHGKPELDAAEPGLRFSLSHSAGLAALAVSSDRPVGVDLQRRRSGAQPARLAARYYPPDEAEFVTTAGTDTDIAARFGWLWSRKEACVKVQGGRLIPGLRWPVRGPGPATAAVLVTDPDSDGGQYLVRDLPAPAGYSAAVAVAGSAPFELGCRWWAPATAASNQQDPNRMAVATC